VPEIAEHVRGRVLALARVQGIRGTPLALSLEEGAHLSGWHGDHESARRLEEKRFRAIVSAPGELGKSTADERRLADQEMLGLGVALVPFDERMANPLPGGSPDDRVSDTIHERIATARRARLEHGPGDVPLQQMDATPGAAREVHELVNEQALARTREPREEDHPPGGQGAEPLGQPLIGVHHDTRNWNFAHSR
jgi:hypothetical protein